MNVSGRIIVYYDDMYLFITRISKITQDNSLFLLFIFSIFTIQKITFCEYLYKYL